MFAVEIKSLTRKFGGFTAVDSLDLSVPAGCIYGFLGLNGAGKSTTIRILATLLPPTSGEARVLGMDVTREAAEVRKVIGLVGDEGGESRPSWTGREYLTYFANVRGLDDPRAHVDGALETVGLDERASRRAIVTYSSGMKRRVEIARALLGSPRVLFLDEPSRGLDIPARRETWTLLRRLAKEEGVTIFLSSHDPAEIHELCESLSVIAKGRQTFAGPARTLGSDAEALEESLLRLLTAEPPPDARSRPSSVAARP